jgi:pSer/pThr/pTyr-binding forkhead associated (FHA) protein
MDRQPVLVVTKGPIEGARFPVEADGLTLGRDEECSVVLDDPNVSRFHARLVFHNASIWVQDAGSRNGVFLNGKRVVCAINNWGPEMSCSLVTMGLRLNLKCPLLSRP